MANPPSNRCGYMWPPDHEVGNYPDNQSCCWRPALSDADRCAWHSDPNKTDKKTIATLQESRPDPAIRDQTNPGAELLGGAVLAGCEIRDSISLFRVLFQGADLSGAYLTDADLQETDLSDANLTDAHLVFADLTNADLIGADLSGAYLYNSDLIGADLIGVDLSGAYLTDADLTNADLSGADLSGATLPRTDLSDADLRGADLTEATLYKADLRGADLTDADLADADLTDADLTDADLTDADLTNASLSNTAASANLERANLTRTDLFDAHLRGAEFYAAVTTDTQINEGTEFGDHYVSDQGTISHAESQQARWCARTVEQVAEDNALPDTAREAFLTRKRLKRREARDEGKRGTWIHLTVSELLMGYGESFKRVLISAVVVIGTATLLYPWLGVRPTGEDSAKLTYPALTPDAPIQFATELVDTLLTAGYFSVLTFTTLGFGDLRPVGFGRVIATAEAGFGVTLFALFVFVLGRRATR